MCEQCDAPEAVTRLSAEPFTASRRQVVFGLSAAVLAPLAFGTRTAGATTPLTVGVDRAGSAPMPEIVPRSVWGGDLPVRGALEVERPEDVRFLLVHHTVGPNEYPRTDSARLLRSIYASHTSAEKGWPDIAYNFLIDRYGVIHEGRTGSLTQPVKGSATGGSQGFAQLCCFMGDHSTTPPTEEAQDAMTRLLAWLADTYAIPVGAGATATFVSRGSNRWPAGRTVTTPTIAGHRDMSQTACPGDGCYPLIESRFRPGAALLVAAGAGTTTTTAPATTAAAPTTVLDDILPSTAPTTGGAAPSDSAPSGSSEVAAASVQDDDSALATAAMVAGGVAVAAAAGVAGYGVVRHRRQEPEPPG